jgi:16S rRNA (uracil1498-N3)-methyltransferase
MARRRWIADEVNGNRAALTGEHAAHLARVLRAQVGQQFDIATPNGVRRGAISAVDPERVEFDLGETVSIEAEGRITILLSIFKFDRYEWAVEKLVELGVAEVVPLIAQRSEKHLVTAARKRVKRWRRIALAAAEQARRGTPPEITEPTAMREALELGGDARIVLVEPGVEEEPAPPLAKTMSELQSAGSMALAIGPEGGWTPREVEAFRARGWKAASLGPTVLRVETAAIAATAIATLSFKQP